MLNDLTGKKFGRLTVLGFSHKEVKKHRKSEKNPFQTTYYWKCKCDCGNTVFVRTSNLTTGNTKSCGCYRKELLAKKNLKHRFIFPVLDTSEKTRCEEYMKLKEEYKEFKNALDEYDNCENFGDKEKKDNLLEEFYDLIQVSVNLIDKLEITSKEKQEAYMKHIEKMIKRGWYIKTYI